MKTPHEILEDLLKLSEIFPLYEFSLAAEDDERVLAFNTIIDEITQLDYDDLNEVCFEPVEKPLFKLGTQEGHLIAVLKAVAYSELSAKALMRLINAGLDLTNEEVKEVVRALDADDLNKFLDMLAQNSRFDGKTFGACDEALDERLKEIMEDPEELGERDEVQTRQAKVHNLKLVKDLIEKNTWPQRKMLWLSALKQDTADCPLARFPMELNQMIQGEILAQECDEKLIGTPFHQRIKPRF